MKTLATSLTSLIVAVWIGVIAIVSVQNFAPVSLHFLIFQSIEIPLGLVLAFSVGAGILGMAIVQPLLDWSSTRDEFDDD